MTPLHPPTMILIIPLMLNTISAPEKWVPTTARAPPEIVHHTADEPRDDLSSGGSSAGSHSWLPPMDLCSDHFGVANTTDSSVLLLLLVSLPDPPGRPGDGDQLVRRHYPAGGRSEREANRTAPWASLPLLEPGSYGVPPHQAREDSFLSSAYPFLSNMSLDVGLFSFLSPTPTTNQHHEEVEAPTLYGVVLCRSADDGNNGSFIQSLFLQDGRRKKISSYLKGVSAARPRKLLAGANNTNSKTRGNLRPRRPVVLDHRKHCILTTGAAAVAVASALLALLCTCTVITGFLLWCKRMNKEPEVDVPGIIRRTDELCPSAPRRYSHRELAVATRGFADEMKIGRGGFGPVYRGYLGDDRNNRHVAIKVLSPPQGQGSSSVQGAREFESEVKVMSRLRHRNIVQLLGWCDDGPSRDRDHLSLVYEFVPNGTLHKHLYDPHRVLTWSDRYSIALGVGSAILYLHTECEQCVVHGDIKPANIMLDSSFHPKLGDFGLARLLDHGADAQTTEVVAGTIGYIDPELVNHRRPSAMSDVYSFGIVLLQIACGMTTSKVVHLLDWVGRMYHQNSILGAADRRLADGGFDERQMKRVLVTGLWCAHHDQSQRPSIAQAMDALRREDAELPEPGPTAMGSLDAVRSLEQRAYGGFSGEDSPCDESPAETEYVSHFRGFHLGSPSARIKY